MYHPIPEDWDGHTHVKDNDCVGCGSYLMGYTNGDCQLCQLFSSLYTLGNMSPTTKDKVVKLIAEYI